MDIIHPLVLPFIFFKNEVKMKIEYLISALLLFSLILSMDYYKKKIPEKIEK